ncbi:MAG: hypothetical protein ACYSWU_13440 [Planctomycetota bacterium]
MVNPRVCELLGIEPPSSADEPAADVGTGAADAGGEEDKDDDAYKIAEGEDD